MYTKILSVHGLSVLTVIGHTPLGLILFLARKMANWTWAKVNIYLLENIRDKLQQMNSEMKNNIRSEMKEMKERLDTLTASLEENKDKG